MNFDPSQFKAVRRDPEPEQQRHECRPGHHFPHRRACSSRRPRRWRKSRSAPDQSTVQKLTAQAAAIDGQIAALGQQQQTATDQIVTQNISNQNDQQMKAQAANQAADHEMNVSLQNFMQWEGQISSDRTDFK